jgi:adenosine deaminase
VPTPTATRPATAACSAAARRRAPGCDLTLRYIHQIGRNYEPNVVFTNMVVGFELAEAGNRYVALNMVQQEEGALSTRDYRLHMRMLDYLRGVYSKAHITLHAGELVPGLVKPKELTYHIREAVLTGHAERIGHGVDVLHEDHCPELLRLMRDKHVMVESPLTSNEQILGVSGWEHPFPTYRAFDVPIALATDDEGISRIDLTGEYRRATTDYHLSYDDLKTLARTSLDHAFLQGDRLWRGPGRLHPRRSLRR